MTLPSKALNPVNSVDSGILWSRLFPLSWIRLFPFRAFVFFFLSWICIFPFRGCVFSPFVDASFSFSWICHFSLSGICLFSFRGFVFFPLFSLVSAVSVVVAYEGVMGGEDAEAGGVPGQ